MEKDNRDYLIIFPDGTYYSKNKSWGGVPLEKATWLTHSIACLLVNKLNQPALSWGAKIQERVK